MKEEKACIELAEAVAILVKYGAYDLAKQVVEFTKELTKS